MNQERKPAVCDTVVVFGAGGDLAQRMIWPSLYHLRRDRLVAEDIRLIGATRQFEADDPFRDFVRQALQRYTKGPELQEPELAAMLSRLAHVRLNVQGDEVPGIDALKAAIGASRRVLYFMATSHALYVPLCKALAAADLLGPDCRVVLEKPIGTDRASSERINSTLAEFLAEEQTLRIDHYLGKETVQNLIALRFANALFEPLWSSVAIDSVQITVAETVGMEGRWAFYDSAGALRDMVQNHMLQLLALVAMEPPAVFDAAAVRNEKTKVLRSLRPIGANEVSQLTVRGQYTAGSSGGQPAPGYAEEKGAKPGSDTETFVAIRAAIDNWRWAGVPFYLRTGKRMPTRRSEIVVQFRNVPHNIFSAYQMVLPANRLVIRLQPEESVTLELLGKQPGIDGIRLGAVPLELSLRDAFGTVRSRIAYERLLLDALHGNSTLFVRRDEIAAAWEWIDGIHSGWQRAGMTPKPYAAGSWGPTAAIALAERHGHSWYE